MLTFILTNAELESLTCCILNILRHYGLNIGRIRSDRTLLNQFSMHQIVFALPAGYSNGAMDALLYVGMYNAWL